MGLSDLLKSVSAAEDLGTAAVIASLMNADQLARYNIAARTNVEAGDVIRFGKVLQLYSDLKPVGEGSETYRKPAGVRPAAPSSTEQAAA